MSSSMVGPYMSTTQYHRRKKKPNAPQLAAQAKHEAWLKKRGIDDESLKKKLKVDRKGNRPGISEIPDYSTGPRVTSDTVPGSGTARAEKRYTGDELLGIGTMHKSNAVPVRKDNPDAARDLANMRR